MSNNTHNIQYNEQASYPTAIVEYRHGRSDYVARLRVSYYSAGPDSGFRFRDLTEAGDGYIPEELVVEVMDELKRRS